MKLLSKFKKQHIYLQKVEKSKSIRYMYSNVHNSTIVIAKTWKQPKCPDDWLKKITHTHTHSLEYYPVIKKNQKSPSAATCVDLENTILGK